MFVIGRLLLNGSGCHREVAVIKKVGRYREVAVTER